MVMIHGWKKILRRAWSIRLMILAGALSAIEFLLPYFADGIPRGWFSLISAIVVIGAFVARLVAQRNMEDRE